MYVCEELHHPKAGIPPDVFLDRFRSNEPFENGKELLHIHIYLLYYMELYTAFSCNISIDISVLYNVWENNRFNSRTWVALNFMLNLTYKPVLPI